MNIVSKLSNENLVKNEKSAKTKNKLQFTLICLHLFFYLKTDLNALLERGIKILNVCFEVKNINLALTIIVKRQFLKKI